MSKPLIGRKDEKAKAAEFHRIVFREWAPEQGYKCYFAYANIKRRACVNAQATDAAHIIPRSQLGNAHAYDCPKDNGRPVCRECHILQEADKLQFPKQLRRVATRVLNELMKCKLREVA